MKSAFRSVLTKSKEVSHAPISRGASVWCRPVRPRGRQPGPPRQRRCWFARGRQRIWQAFYPCGDLRVGGALGFNRRVFVPANKRALNGMDRVQQAVYCVQMALAPAHTGRCTPHANEL